MAGSYPDTPANRMPIDQDGAILYSSFNGLPTNLNALNVLNNEDTDDLGLTSNLDYYTIAWGTKRDIQALYLGFVQSDPNLAVQVQVEGSKDTYSHESGTWFEIFPANTVQTGSTLGWWGHVAPGDYRRYIRPVPVLAAAKGLNALRFRIFAPQVGAYWKFRSAHLFGEYSLGVPKNDAKALAMVTPSLLNPVRVEPDHLDYGNVSGSSSEDRSFRVRNLSSRFIAREISIYVSVLTDALPKLGYQFLFSVDRGKTFYKEVPIADLMPGETSRTVVIVRRITPSDAQPGPWAGRVMFGLRYWEDTVVVRPSA